MDFKDNGSSIQITFPSAKNDQFHQGQITCVTNNDTIIDPVVIIQNYFQICNMRFGFDNKDTFFVNCVLSRNKQGWFTDKSRGVSYSTATKDVRRMLEKVGIPGKSMTHKSFKSLGVTKTLDAGVVPEHVISQGRWRTTGMPNHYKVNSIQFKEDIASQVPV